MESTTITLTGNKSNLTAYFHPEIELDDKYNYSCALLDFHTYNSIPNVDEKNNTFRYELGDDQDYKSLTVGSYEIEDICSAMNNYFRNKQIDFHIKGNKATMKCVIDCDIKLILDFDVDNSIGPLLGFELRTLENKIHYKSSQTVNITHINTIRIDCDLVTGSFHNGQSTHTLHEFSPAVGPGYKIIEQPKNLIYLPTIRRRINTLNVSIVDQNNRLIDFRGENVTCRLHIKRET